MVDQASNFPAPLVLFIYFLFSGWLLDIFSCAVILLWTWSPELLQHFPYHTVLYWFNSSSFLKIGQESSWEVLSHCFSKQSELESPIHFYQR